MNFGERSCHCYGGLVIFSLEQYFPFKIKQFVFWWKSTQVGWTAIFGLNFLLIVANLLYIGFAVKDKKKPVQDGNFGKYLEVM